jgi:hypothetical protein
MTARAIRRGDLRRIEAQVEVAALTFGFLVLADEEERARCVVIEVRTGLRRFPGAGGMTGVAIRGRVQRAVRVIRPGWLSNAKARPGCEKRDTEQSPPSHDPPRPYGSPGIWCPKVYSERT